MKIRHRVPTIFSIYMVDVLCCALGCVILLWQVNFFEAEEQTAAARDSLDNLKKANVSLDALSSQLANLKNELDSASYELDASKKREVQVTLRLDESRLELTKERKLALVYKNDYETAKKDQATLAALLDEEQRKLRELSKKNEAALADLAENLKLGLDMARKMKEAEAKIAALEKDLEAKKSDVLAASRKMDSQTLVLVDAESRNKKLLVQLSDLQASMQARLSLVDLRSKILEDDLLKTRGDLSVSSKLLERIREEKAALDKLLAMRNADLANSSVIITNMKDEANRLSKDNERLQGRVVAIQQAADNRFAGITLTGNRIIFLVDMSGSMELVEETIADPDKWPTVCETVGKLMKSLPNLRQYQVILFSDKARYPLGNDGRWFEYLPQHSPKATVDALKAVKPKGETNMYAAFNEAFTFRELGLDTVYVLSDGLPTAGEGLPLNTKILNESQKTEMLGKYLRNRLKTVWNRPILNQDRVRINTIGFFYESPDVGAFLWALAREHDGSFVGMSRP